MYPFRLRQERCIHSSAFQLGEWHEQGPRMEKLRGIQTEDEKEKVSIQRLGERTNKIHSAMLSGRKNCSPSLEDLG